MDPLFRLAVAGMDASHRQTLSARLVGVSLVSWGTAGGGLAAGSGDAARKADWDPNESDAVAFLSPSDADVETISKLLLAGKHVLAVPHADLTLERLNQLESVAGRGRACLAFVNPERYSPSRRLIRQQLNAGKLGSVGLVRVHRWETSPDPVRSDSNRRTGDWQATWCDLDLTLWLVGGRPEVVYAAVRPSDGPWRYLQMHLGFPGGAMAIVDYSNQLPDGDSYGSLSVIGSAGAAYSDDHANMQLLYQGGQARAIRTTEGLQHWSGLLQEFAGSARSQAGQVRGIADWRAVAAVSAAVRESIASRRAVQLEAD
jgi:predicted dehydrogenase